LHYGRGRHWSKGKADRKWIYIERDALAIGRQQTDRSTCRWSATCAMSSRN
jgi:hypothetical protein